MFLIKKPSKVLPVLKALKHAPLNFADSERTSSYSEALAIHLHFQATVFDESQSQV